MATKYPFNVIESIYGAPYSERALKRIAYHEAGHAVVRSFV